MAWFLLLVLACLKASTFRLICLQRSTMRFWKRSCLKARKRLCLRQIALVLVEVEVVSLVLAMALEMQMASLMASLMSTFMKVMTCLKMALLEWKISTESLALILISVLKLNARPLRRFVRLRFLLLSRLSVVKELWLLTSSELLVDCLSLRSCGKSC